MQWLASLDGFGIVTDRAVILEGATLAQNLTMPFTLAIDPIEPETLERVVRLANECDIAPQWLDQQGGSLPPAVRARTHLARAIALGPALLLMEHPAAALPEAERGAFGSSSPACARRARWLRSCSRTTRRLPQSPRSARSRSTAPRGSFAR